MTVWQALAKTIAPRAMRTVGEQKDTTATKLGRTSSTTRPRSQHAPRRLA